MTAPDAWYWNLTGRIFVQDEEFDRHWKWVNTSNPHSFPHKAGLKEQQDYDQIEPLFSESTIQEELEERIQELHKKQKNLREQENSENVDEIQRSIIKIGNQISGLQQAKEVFKEKSDEGDSE